VEAAGAVFIGPAARFLDLMGDKVNGRERMAEAGFPVFPGSARLPDAAAALHAAEEIGYPLMLKPAGGGGGIGMHRVAGAEELRRAFGRASRMAAAAFDDDGLFLEQAVSGPRHVEIQVLGDGDGGALHLYERECSLQRRHQKVIEEAPAPGLDRRIIEDLAEQAAAAVAAMGYDSIGTVEMLRSDSGAFGFIEMNTRIQVEHGVTEAVTGLDLVAAQIRLAAGGPLPERPPLAGFAIEARVYAENPRTGHASTGTLAHFRVPDMHGVRVDTGYAAGQAVTPYYDPLLAKVIAAGHTREQAIGRLLVGLKGFEIRGVATNIPLLKAVLEDEDFLAGNFDTGFLSSGRWWSEH
jgi:acetyl-CoA carboxylase biotin carboxylase subunit